jgi:hypothetical protein
MAMLSGLYASTKVAVYLALHPWTEKAGQAVFTLSLGLATVIAQHYLRRFLKRISPDDPPPLPLPLPQGVEPGRARVGLLDLFRRGLVRLRKSKRPPAES